MKLNRGEIKKRERGKKERKKGGTLFRVKTREIYKI